jgi:hypothetical protein
MIEKERYYALDDIGFIGDQSRTEAQVQRDIKRFSRYLKEHKLGIYDPKVAKRKRKLRSE